MPKALLDFMGYVFFFWSREDYEPPHVHVCKGAPSKVSAKFLIEYDEIIMEHNDAQIPAKDLKKIQMYISLNKRDIFYEWGRYEWFRYFVQ